MNDEQYYLKATKELDEENRNEGLWAKAMAMNDGDEKKAKYYYIRERALQFKNIKKEPSNNPTTLKPTRIVPPSSERIKGKQNLLDPSPKKIPKSIDFQKGISEGEKYLAGNIDIRFDGEHYYFQKYRYLRFSDSLNFAKNRKKEEADNPSERDFDVAENTLKEKGGFISQLISGNLGLAKTYWVYGVLFGNVFLVGLGQWSESSGSLPFSALVLLSYII